MKSPDYKAGNLICLAGTKLWFDEADTETGVFLKPATDRVIRVSEYGKRCDTSIVWKIPDTLFAGDIDVEVRTRSKDGKIMIGYLAKPVALAA